MISKLAISGYRSIRDLVLPLARLTLVTGANGTGKSNVYKALRLLADVAQGRVVASLAAEGGLTATLWAGPERISRAMRSGAAPVQGTVRKAPVALRLGFAGEDYGYAIDLGLPQPTQALFPDDPEIKCEALWTGETLKRANLFVERRGAAVRMRGSQGTWITLERRIGMFESMMTHANDPREAPELLGLREAIRDWRFHDQIRTDRDAPLRSSNIATYTPIIAADGSDLAAAIGTIRRIGDGDALDEAFDDAFPGSIIETGDAASGHELRIRQHGLLRPMRTAELSDGTLRYLFLLAALLSPRPAGLIVLNEPETSLHPDLLPALGRLIRRAARESQIIIVSHA
ncbi:MAG: AAA family ATPase, partial [Geminicoccaceae bacterium]|nr:AAA family ATPase [Geminicoccaceae bacterium]